MPERIDADVCVVGAGYAGLTAARRLTQHGKSVVVLEARDRVGGRIWTQHLADGSAVDRGGAWLAPYHDAIYALAAEVGVSTYKTYVDGAHLLVDGERTRRYTGLIPKISPLAVITIALGAGEARPDVEEGSARRSVEREARGGVGLAIDRLLPRTHRHPDRHRTRPLRDGRARPVHRRPERHVVPSPPVPRPRAPQHQQPLLDRGRLAGEHGRRRCRLDRPAGRRRSSETRCACARRSVRSRNATITSPSPRTISRCPRATQSSRCRPRSPSTSSSIRSCPTTA